MGIDLTQAVDIGPSRLRVLVVGCGKIAGGFDEGRSDSDLPLTHAGAYVRDGRFKLTACVEPDAKRLDEFMAAWNIPVGFRSIEEAFESAEQFDVISICSPSGCHANDLKISLQFKPKLIFCEKPVTTSIEETEDLVVKCRESKILLAVNYSRRWDPDIQKFQADMRANHWGELRSIIGLYNKGILNNGSHMIDLLHLLFGSLVITNVGKPVHDFSVQDPTVDVWLEAPHGISAHLVCGNAADFALFELQFVFSRGVLAMEEGGMFWRERGAVDSPSFKGYRSLHSGDRRLGKYPQAMLKAVDNIYRSIELGDPLAGTGESALCTQKVCENIRQLANEPH
jgi:predicted dehydrogenase